MRIVVVTLGICLLSCWFSKAQQTEGYLSYGTEKDMPAFFLKAREHLTYPMAWGYSAVHNFGKWRKVARQTVLDCMARQPEKADFDPVVLQTEKREGYEVRKIVFNLSEYSRVPAYLLVPEGKGPFPAMVMLHDHGAKFSIGKEKMVKPFAVREGVVEESGEWAVQCYDGVYVGDEYARQGYVVLAVDALFWGERGRKEGVKYESQQALAANLLQLGLSWGGLIVWDDLRSVEFLESLPEVDAGRIGALGFSMGAHRAWMLAAVSDKVKAAAAICWMNTTDSLMTLSNNQNKGQSAFSMIIPGIRNYLDYPHVASIACPKPVLFFNGRRDKLFPVAGVERAYAIMKEVWQSQGVADRLVTRVWDSPHFFSRPMQEETLNFFDRYLK